MTVHILLIILFMQKNLKTPKTNGVPLSQAKLFTMKYYRFSRRRKNYLFGLSDFFKSRKISTKKQDYMVNTGRSKILDSFYFENQVWVLFTKLGRGMSLAKIKERMRKWKYTHVEFKSCNMT
jgi:hypothetical protein